MAAKNNSNEIKLTRIYDADVRTVWEAWADPDQAAHWYGPRGHTIITHSKDLKPGGIWHYTMFGPDGTEYPNKTKYLEVEKYSRLVYDHGGNDERAPLFRVTVLFADIKGKTKLDFTMSFPSPEIAEQTRKFIKKAGGDGTWDRFAEYLIKKTTGAEKFVINRSFDVPLETMFEMWTDPKHMAQWSPPTGFTMEFIKSDIRAGGSSFYFMTNGSDGKMYGRAKYIEITRPNRLVYTQQFCNEKEIVTRHPLSPTWPETMLTTVLFTQEEPGRTRVTLTWEPYGEVTAAEVETFVKARAGMTQGWTGSLDKLEDYASTKS